MFNGRSAMAILKSSSDDPRYKRIYGEVYFKELVDGGCRIYGMIEGAPHGWIVERGLHIHKYGNIKNKCKSMSGHYNPFSKNHGSRLLSNGQVNYERHLGDLGNITFDPLGIANFDFVDPLVQLAGPYSVVGRGLVLHENQDDLGMGGNEESLKTGNAGSRIACGIIGLTHN